MIKPLLRYLPPLVVASWMGAVLAQAGPQPSLPITRLNAGIHVVHAEVASTTSQRSMGLMLRTELGPNAGMLFVFDDAATHCMWMRNTLIPLSVAFIDDRGTITNIENMEPRTENSHCAARPARFALEMTKGWFAKRGIKAGASMAGLPKH